MNLQGEKILVTGADGFIGSHLTEELVRRGCHVRAFVMYNSFNSWGWLDQSPQDIRAELDIFAGDVRDPNGVRTAMEGCTVVFHLAALIGIPYSYHSPDSYLETNVRGTLNIVQAARQLKTTKVIHTSTSEVYGTARFVPITEDHPLQGQSPYSASKTGADQMALSFHHSFGTPIVIVRPFNTYGPRQSARAIIPTVITQIASGNPTIQLGSLEPTRDFSFVDDTVRGFIAAAESERAVGEVVNLGTGHEISIRETVELISEIMGSQIELRTDTRRLRPGLSEVERLCADNSKAQRLLCWKPTYADREGLRAGLARTIEWITDPLNLCCYKSDRYNV